MLGTVGSVITLDNLDHAKFVVTAVHSGAFGIVYFLRSPNPYYPQFALKMLKNPTQQDAIQREAVLWAEIGYHPNIAEIIATGFINDGFYILSQKYDSTLADLEPDRMEPADIERTVAGICQGLEFAHDTVALVHKDIKPTNIFMSDDTPKIGDFGLSAYDHLSYYLTLDSGQPSIATRRIRSPGEPAGTLPFIAPELFHSSPSFSLSTDIYALGVTIFNWLTGGEFPFVNQQDQLDFADDSKLSAFLHSHQFTQHEKVARFVERCLSLPPTDRWHDYSEILDFLEAKPRQRQHTDDDTAGIVAHLQLLRRLGNQEQAKLTLLRALEQYPSDPLLLNQAAVIEIQSGNLSSAKGILRSILDGVSSLDWQHYDVFFNFFWLCLRTKDPGIDALCLRLDSIRPEHKLPVRAAYWEFGLYLYLRQQYDASCRSIEIYHLSREPILQSVGCYLLACHAAGAIGHHERELFEKVRTDELRQLIFAYLDPSTRTQTIQGIKRYLLGGEEHVPLLKK